MHKKLKEIKEIIYKQVQNINNKDRNYRNEPNRYPGPEKYSRWNKDFIRRNSLRDVSRLKKISSYTHTHTHIVSCGNNNIKEENIKKKSTINICYWSELFIIFGDIGINLR